MSKLRIYIDENYPKRLVDILVEVHELQREKCYELIHGSFPSAKKGELENAILLLLDNKKKKGLEIPTIKHYEDGGRVIACKAGFVEKFDRFEFAMTVLRVWPFIIDKANNEYEPFLYTFKYGGNRLSKNK